MRLKRVFLVWGMILLTMGFAGTCLAELAFFGENDMSAPIDFDEKKFQIKEETYGKVDDFVPSDISGLICSGNTLQGTTS